MIGQGHGEHLVDAQTIHVNNFQLPLFQGHQIAGVWNTTKEQHDKPSEGGIVMFFFFRQANQLQTVLQLGQRDQAIEQPAAVGAPEGPVVLAILLLEIPRQRLQQILLGDQSLQLAIFVPHQRHLFAVGAEVVEQLDAVEGLGQQAALLGQGSQIDGLPLDIGVQHLADIDDTHQF